jgi:rRNA pseudouridine-1189 N-methylase Emg1 (Nep1/Mra1 family)
VIKLYKNILKILKNTKFMLIKYSGVLFIYIRHILIEENKVKIYIKTYNIYIFFVKDDTVE